ncbi:M20/M25/M40 family metallo-hydrolase [Cupriavidus plantarum]|uniref:M20/M25/M40 family metallo-hydrolase n=1 Tax=Cupriavidus plantarum TaxID=942865 RepID=UPI000E25C417|nr:M20/M25/M40 family metallo-hydrolase [Cupriavidus plantarum]REE85497.1 succinyl-diaminopimelate desuccinylase [Cupriavidus plantarum]CAG2145995.1 N-formyl-4-amino-5-aminomethyl-2-methylpyrimidinedeformylase [Cupriavidus plantarum]SMR86654.1 succinyl-diaminopimelate desuccinylase [Cupriavidus plantarum]
MHDILDTTASAIPITAAPHDTRARLASAAHAASTDAIDIARRLIAVPSASPPGDTHAMADEIAALAADIPGVRVERYGTLPHVMNLVLRLEGNGPGRTLVFNGHMDTFPLVNAGAWTADAAGEVRGGDLYGLGVSDMKGGIAAILVAMRQLADCRHAWRGAVVATFVGDEETMGVEGTQYLLEHVPHARGDAMISADTGSMRVLRFGEKGMVWLTLRARGASAHAAHVHKGDSAIEKLMRALDALMGLRDMPVSSPPTVLAAIREAGAVSEALSGTGESDVLRRITMTIGTIRGGRLPNLVADEAEATVDLRLPVGTSVADVEHELAQILQKCPGVEAIVERRYEPSWTTPDHPVIATLRRCCEEVSGVPSVVNMRVGASDARLYRRAGVPTVVCGLTPRNMGAPDEHVSIAELRALAEAFALAGFDFLTA